MTERVLADVLHADSSEATELAAPAQLSAARHDVKMGEGE
jgi:hypothetical protein